MDVRANDSSERGSTNSTELEIEVQFVWPAGAAEFPVYVDGFGVWPIEWGSISR